MHNNCNCVCTKGVETAGIVRTAGNIRNVESTGNAGNV
jgi:hypothetical protein